MFKKKINNIKGFTLIELLVVIAIIGLLSSIVLASLKDARDKSTTAKFKSEINQFVNALELYKNRWTKYPYEDGVSGAYYTTEMTNGSVEKNTPVGLTLSGPMGEFLKSLPKVPANSYDQTATAWMYFTNHPTAYPMFQCTGDAKVPKYIIMFMSQNPLTYSTFSNLPTAEIIPAQGATPIPQAFRCFSLK